jgi:large subunit ribosomal protein L13
MKSFVAKQEDVQRSWLLVDATDKPAGRLAVRLAEVLRGKNKPTFTPNVDTGAFVVVINAEKVRLTGNKDDQKIYKHYTGFNSGLREIKAKVIRERNPARIIEQAVHGMLPKNRLSRTLLGRLKVYAGADHPHEAQKPQSVELL